MNNEQLDAYISELDTQITDLVILRDNLRALQKLEGRISETERQTALTSIRNEITQKSDILPYISERAEAKREG